MSEEDNTNQTISSVLMPPGFDMSEEELFLLQKTYDPRLYLPSDDPRLVQLQPNTDVALASSVAELVESSTHPFPIWRTILLGTSESVSEIVTFIEEAGCKIDAWARDISRKVTLVTIPIAIGLVRVKVRELGFSKGATRQQIYARALQLRLALCPAIVGLQLRQQYLNQKFERLAIAMEPIPNKCGHLYVFGVSHEEDGLWLNVCSGDSDTPWCPDDTWVFTRCKSRI